MEVLYRLRIDGNENSDMNKDGEIQYPVFIESLHSEEIFRYHRIACAGLHARDGRDAGYVRLKLCAETKSE